MKSRMGVILFLLITAVSLPLLIIALRQFNILTPKASGTAPEFLTEANVTDTSATLLWATGETEVVTNVQWGDSTLLGTITPDYRDQRDKTSVSRTTHMVSLTGLKPNTTYYYRIVSGETTYPPATEQPYSFTTTATPTNTAPTQATVYGEVAATKNSDAILFAYVHDGTGITTIHPIGGTINPDNTFVVNLSLSRSENGNYRTLTKESTIVLVYISRGSGLVQKITPAQSPLSLTASTPISQSAIDELVVGTTSSPTTTPTPLTTQLRQDVPLSKPGTTTPIPTTTVAQSTSGVTKEQVYSMFAAPSLSNISDSSGSIMYFTRDPIIGTLQYGSNTLMGSSRFDDSDNATQTAKRIHHFTITGLAAATRYYFKTSSDSSERTFTTPSKIAYPSGQTIIAGTIVNGTGECLVRNQIKRGTVTSSVITTTPSGVSWTVNIAPVRTSSLESFLVPGPSDTLITNVFCVASDGNMTYGSTAATVQTSVSNGVTVQMGAIQ